MSKVYNISVDSGTGGDDSVGYADAFGNVDIMSYIGRQVVADIADVDGDVTLHLTEVDQIGGTETRSIAKLTADAQTVSYVLKAKLTAERKAAKVPPVAVFGNEASTEPAPFGQPALI